MTIQPRSSGHVDILELAGTLDGTGLLKHEARDLLGRGRARLVVDLSGVVRMTSSGLGELVTVYQLAHHAGGSVKLLRPGEEIVSILRLCRLEDVFEIHREETSAIASFVA